MLHDNVSFKPSCITMAKLGMEAWENRHMAWNWIGLAVCSSGAVCLYVLYKWNPRFLDVVTLHNNYEIQFEFVPGYYNVVQ